MCQVDPLDQMVLAVRVALELTDNFAYWYNPKQRLNKANIMI